MSEKKCKVCCSDAKWVWKDGYYCQRCLRAELEVWQQDRPRVCEMCRADLDDRVYYTDSEDNPFCSPECALEYYDAKKLEEENDNESGN